ncbi:MAG: hypothetical protein WBV94_33195 [Blastocatellia bacterium]
MPIRYRANTNLGQAEDLVGQAVKAEFEPLGDSLVNSLQSEWPEDTGKSKKTIRKRITGRGLLVRMLIFAASAYAEWIEKGRPKGAKQPPPDKILAWVKRKGWGRAFNIKTRKLVRGRDRKRNLRTGRDTLLRRQKSIAFLIGRSIKRKGIKGKFLFRDLRQKHDVEINSMYDRLRSRVAQLLNK